MFGLARSARVQKRSSSQLNCSSAGPSTCVGGFSKCQKSGSARGTHPCGPCRCRPWPARRRANPSRRSRSCRAPGTPGSRNACAGADAPAHARKIDFPFIVISFAGSGRGAGPCDHRGVGDAVLAAVAGAVDGSVGDLVHRAALMGADRREGLELALLRLGDHDLLLLEDLASPPTGMWLFSEFPVGQVWRRRSGRWSWWGTPTDELLLAPYLLHPASRKAAPVPRTVRRAGGSSCRHSERTEEPESRRQPDGREDDEETESLRPGAAASRAVAPSGARAFWH